MAEEDPQDRQQRLQAAGAWLKTQREARGWSGSDLARRLDVPQSRVSAYERGQYEVSNEAAEQISTTLDVPIIEARRQLGLWVPSERDLSGYARYVDPSQIDDDALINEIVRRYKKHSDREVIDVYPTRSKVPGELWDHLIHDAKNQIILGGYTNYFFWTERPNFTETIREKVAAGVEVRILVGDPESEVTRRRQAIERTKLELATRINITLEQLAKLGDLPGLEVRTSHTNAEAHVSRSIFAFDRELLVSEHIADRLGHGSLTFHLQRKQEDGAFEQYKAHFEHLWIGGRAWQAKDVRTT
ncbi:helix-turn-helix domain-containing protein [Parafrankia soli]|uniref:helix-turn-helix domain-containing protein n=1 Tax=Parafrankia soli TaxID=2599596 RepID=UPI0009F5239B|nr:helix-turn-helix domain-containing protein [Parafrankia soli]